MSAVIFPTVFMLEFHWPIRCCDELLNSTKIVRLNWYVFKPSHVKYCGQTLHFGWNIKYNVLICLCLLFVLVSVCVVVCFFGQRKSLSLSMQISVWIFFPPYNTNIVNIDSKQWTQMNGFWKFFKEANTHIHTPREGDTLLYPIGL